MTSKLVEVLANPVTPVSLRAFLEVALAEHKPPQGLPELYARAKHGFAGRALGGPIVTVEAGTRVRITHAGKFGELGITNILDESKNYQALAGIIELTDFSSRR